MHSKVNNKTVKFLSLTVIPQVVDQILSLIQMPLSFFKLAMHFIQSLKQ